MAIEVTDLTTLDASKVTQNLKEITARIQEVNPSIDVKRGAFHDLLAYFHALLSTGEQVNLDRYLGARSLRQIQEDPTLSDDDVVEDILSNYLLTRKEGATARGEVTIVVTDNTTVTISSGAVFEAEGKQFTADSVFTAKAQAALVDSPTDRLFTQLGDGNYAFTVNVTAAETDTDSILAKDVELTPAAAPVGFVTAYATSDFAGGINDETNTELINRLQQGIAARAPSNRVNMKAHLRSLSEFPTVVDSSVVGYGDEEMLRDQHSILPLSLGGRADWYIRTQEKLLHKAVTKEATLLSVDFDGVGTWQFSFGKDEMPGFYEVSSVRLSNSTGDAGTFTISADTRSNDLTGAGFVNDIKTTAEGAYSRYQTAVIQFKDDKTNHSLLTVGAKANYAVTVKMLPLIAEIHDKVNNFDTRSYGADILVKAPVPCFVQLSVTIQKKTTDSDPDTAAIKDALAAEVNNVGFLGRLYAAQLHDIVHGFLPDEMSSGAMDMLGRLRYPDGSIHYVHDTTVLAIASVDGAMVSPRTVQFFSRPDDIAVSVATGIPVPA